MNVFQKKVWSIILALGIVLLLVFGGVLLIPKSERGLTEEQISTLREQYPVCGIQAPPMMSLALRTVKQHKENVDSFVYAEVIGGMTTYTKPFTSGSAEVDHWLQEDVENEKLAMDQLKDAVFYEYTLRVIDDTDGRYEKGEIITIAASMMFYDYFPKLVDGMQVIVPVIRDDKVTSRNWYGIEGMFYVTEDGYAIAAYDEAGAYYQFRYSDEIYSGYRVRDVLKKLKRL